MAEPRISVIVPVYGAEAWLDRCAASILGQTVEDIELLLVEDGSPDGCPALCDAWAARDGRVTVLHRENGGVSAARNAGLDRARGRYIAFADADDWLEPDALEYLLSLLEGTGADMACGAYVSVPGGPAPFWPAGESVLAPEEFQRLLFKDGTQISVQYPWGKLFRRELFQRVRFPEGITNGEDIPAVFALSLGCGRIVLGDRPVYRYFRHAESVTRRSFGEKSFHLLAAWDLVVRTAQERGCGEEILRLARLGRMRADFGVLCNLAMSERYDEDRIAYRERIAPLRQAVRQNAGTLLRARMPLSRKLLLVGFCVSYPAAARLMNLALRLGIGGGRTA